VVIVLGTIEIDPEQRAEFLAGQEAELEESRAEPGCVEFLMLADHDRADLVRLLEVWEDTASYEAHLPRLQARQESTPPSPLTSAVRGVQITRHDVASSTPLF
jgi:quinol monooxygenase YgiN